MTEVIKSPSEKRDIKYLQLANKLRVVLISDKETKKSSASLSVHVGSGIDPKEFLGLAHFCEHMLFMGT